MSGTIEDIARRYWYGNGVKDRALSRKISNELYRYTTIEKAARDLVEHKDDPEKLKALKKALRPLSEYE